MTDLRTGRYRIVEPLGGGGTSLVYRARALSGGPDAPEVALKQLRPQFAADPSLRRRFLREAELARGLEHPGIVRVMDAGEERGAPFLVMELVRGETLRQRLDRDRALDPAAVWPIFGALAQALDHAHGRGVIHRDVKPQNIFLTADGGVKLADFGNARVISLASVTGASVTWGTPEYAAPEMFLRGRADPRSDLYALGVVGYEMLTGRLPWSRAQALTRLGGRPGVAVQLAPTGAGENVDGVLADLMSFTPGERPASGAEVVARLWEPTTLVAARKTTCRACGATRPDDVPRCLACGQEVVRLAHDPAGRWRIFLDDLQDDAAATETLLRVLEPLVQPVRRALHFLTGNHSMYSKAELKTGIELPAVLLSDLDEPTARALEAIFRKEGLRVHAARSTSTLHEVGVTASRASFWISAAFMFIWSSSAGLLFSRSMSAALALGAGALGAMSVTMVAHRRWLSTRKEGLVRLRPQIAAVPAADRLLADAAQAGARIQAPEVRALLGELATELYRLTRRAEELAARARARGAASGEADLLRRTIDAAPALTARLHRIAEHLDGLDAALAGPREGEMMQSLARLERAAALPGADRAALAATRRDVEAALERRHATEEERARLAAALCQMLGRLRQLYRRAGSLQSPDEAEARAIETASAELDDYLARDGGGSALCASPTKVGEADEP